MAPWLQTMVMCGVSKENARMPASVDKVTGDSEGWRYRLVAGYGTNQTATDAIPACANYALPSHLLNAPWTVLAIKELR